YAIGADTIRPNPAPARSRLYRLPSRPFHGSVPNRRNPDAAPALPVSKIRRASEKLRLRGRENAPLCTGPKKPPSRGRKPVQRRCRVKAWPPDIGRRSPGFSKGGRPAVDRRRYSPLPAVNVGPELQPSLAVHEAGPIQDMHPNRRRRGRD